MLMPLKRIVIGLSICGLTLALARVGAESWSESTAFFNTALFRDTFGRSRVVHSFEIGQIAPSVHSLSAALGGLGFERPRLCWQRRSRRLGPAASSADSVAAVGIAAGFAVAGRPVRLSRPERRQRLSPAALAPLLRAGASSLHWGPVRLSPRLVPKRRLKVPPASGR